MHIGFEELILLAGLGLIVLGPQRLPRVAVQLGRWVGQARRMSRMLMYQLRQEVNLDDPGPFASRGPSMSERAREGAQTDSRTGARAGAGEAKSKESDAPGEARSSE